MAHPAGEFDGPRGASTPAATRPWHYLWALRPYVASQRGPVILGSLGGVVMNTAIVLPAILLGHAINVVAAFAHAHATAAQVGVAAGLLVVGNAATEVPRIAKRYWLGVARVRVNARVRADALRGALTPAGPGSVELVVGDVMARIIGDVDVVSTGLNEVMVETWDTLLFSASLVVAMFVISPSLTAMALAPVPVALWLAHRASARMARRTTLAREAQSRLTEALREQLGALRLLRLFGRTSAAAATIGALARDQADAEVRAIRLEESLSAGYATLLSAGAVVIIAVGGHRVVAATMSLGSLVAFLALFVRVVTRAPRIALMATRVPAGAAAYQRLEALLASSRTSRDARERSAARTGAVRVRFAGVHYAFPDAPHPALVDLDVEVAPGSLLCVTGPVGAGKSAFARLAAGLVAPTSGVVEIDGRSTAELAPAWRAAVVGYVGQEPDLFSGTILDNVTLWESDATSDPPRSDHSPSDLTTNDTATNDTTTNASAASDLARALSIAALDDDLATMPTGVLTTIGEMGVRVSGGQRQRIAVARALAAQGRTPALVVLDDPFSAVDVGTEAQIVAALRAAFGPDAPAHERATIVVVSHRLAAFPLADEVLVLDAGRVVERGGHHELVARGGLYARIVRAQSLLEPAANVDPRADDARGRA